MTATAGAEPGIPFVVSQSGLLVILSPDRLRAACARRGWSLTELATRARVSRPTLRSALRGHPVRPRTAWKLARTLREGPAEPTIDDLVDAA